MRGKPCKCSRKFVIYLYFCLNPRIITIHFYSLFFYFMKPAKHVYRFTFNGINDVGSMFADYL